MDFDVLSDNHPMTGRCLTRLRRRMRFLNKIRNAFNCLHVSPPRILLTPFFLYLSASHEIINAIVSAKHDRQYFDSKTGFEWNLLDTPWTVCAKDNYFCCARTHEPCPFIILFSAIWTIFFYDSKYVMGWDSLLMQPDGGNECCC